MAIVRAQLLSDLKRDENPHGQFVPYVYDDATGTRVVPGYTMVGNATLLTGWCPDKNPATEEIDDFVTGYWLDRSNAMLLKAMPWIEKLPDPCSNALANMAYQIGVHGLQTFGTFLALMMNGKYKEAADDLWNTKWFKESGGRALRIQALIRQGAT